MGTIQDRETKHRLLLESGFLYDEDRGVYCKETNYGSLIQINQQEFDRQYLHQLDNLVKEREYMAKEAFINDNQH